MVGAMATGVARAFAARGRRPVPRATLVVLSLLLGLLGVALSAPAAGAAEARTPRRTFDLAAGPPFAAFRSVVEAYARKHRPATTNDFCLLPEVASDDSKHVWVIWSTG